MESLKIEYVMWKCFMNRECETSHSVKFRLNVKTFSLNEENENIWFCETKEDALKWGKRLGYCFLAQVTVPDFILDTNSQYINVKKYFTTKGVTRITEPEFYIENIKNHSRFITRQSNEEDKKEILEFFFYIFSPKGFPFKIETSHFSKDILDWLEETYFDYIENMPFYIEKQINECTYLTSEEKLFLTQSFMKDIDQCLQKEILGDRAVFTDNCIEFLYDINYFERTETISQERTLGFLFEGNRHDIVLKILPIYGKEISVFHPNLIKYLKYIQNFDIDMMKEYLNTFKKYLIPQPSFQPNSSYMGESYEIFHHKSMMNSLREISDKIENYEEKMKLFEDFMRVMIKKISN